VRETDIWAWAQAAYARPGAREACLALQDQHGQNVCLLLWAAWSGAPVEALARGVALARAWEQAVVSPLRQVRRELKAQAGPIDAAGRERLREDIKAAELEAERLLLEALARLAGAGSGAPEAALRAAAAAWGRKLPDAALAALARALD
jgi:uncharacterized protein (TIGR02444 family)